VNNVYLTKELPFMLIVLDRDGVINEESDAYIKSPDEWQPIPGSLAAIAALKAAGHTVVVATNQSGVGRGYYTHATLEQIHAKFRRLLQAAGGEVDGIFYCPHRPEDHCDCRKPKPGLFQQIAQAFPVDWRQALSVGDALRDIQAAQAVGCPAVLVRTGRGQLTQANGVGLDGVPIFDDLAAWVRALNQQQV
jgi:D-glycero-D-manno-heptose 1,7-bisphosphate phosphatase